MSDMRNGGEDRDRRRYRMDGAWVGALVLIGIGVVFLLRNIGYPLPEHWWAFFLLIPAIGALATAWNAYRQHRTFDGPVIGSLFAAAILIGLALIFLLNVDINWNLLWPVVLILLGLGILLRSVRRR